MPGVCEECRADDATLRCSKCKIFYCSKTCQARNWKIHKHVCSTDPADRPDRPFVPVEMAIERTLAKLPTLANVPKGAFCYICLEGGDGLMRGCACRGDSAGFVHLECLTKLAETKDESDQHRDEARQALIDVWTQCTHCKRGFTGPRGMTMFRRFWRRYRSSEDMELRYYLVRELADIIGDHGELDAATQLLGEASKCAADDMGIILNTKRLRAMMLVKNGQSLDGLDLLKATLAQVKEHTADDPILVFKTMYDVCVVSHKLGRIQECLDTAMENVALAKAEFGPEDGYTLIARNMYAQACTQLGRVEEAKVIFDDVLATQTRVFGREHQQTQYTMKWVKYIAQRKATT